MDALGLLELSSIARGYRALDALVKRSPITVLQANLVEPGHYLVLFGGGVAEVEEAMLAGLEVAKGCVLASLQLPMVHEQVLSGLQGTVGLDAEPDTLGIVEAKTVSGGLQACDRALKDDYVSLAGLRIAPGLGGRSYFVVQGAQHDVEAALESARVVLGDGAHALECVPRPHPDFVAQVLRAAPFSLSPQSPS